MCSWNWDESITELTDDMAGWLVGNALVRGAVSEDTARAQSEITSILFKK
jgi:hypothetical protein